MFHFILFFAFGSAIPNLLRCCFCIVSVVASLLFLAGCYPVGCILVREMAMVTAISKTSMEILFSSPISIIWSGDIPTTVVVRVRGFRSQSNLQFGENACAYTHTHIHTQFDLYLLLLLLYISFSQEHAPSQCGDVDGHLHWSTAEGHVSSPGAATDCWISPLDSPCRT